MRKDGAVVDPFLGNAISGNCLIGDAPAPGSLWTPSVREQLTYSDGQVIETGFAAKPVLAAETEQGAILPPLADSPALIFFARVINLRAGDSLRFKVDGPGAFQADSETSRSTSTRRNMSPSPARSAATIAGLRANIAARWR